MYPNNQDKQNSPENPAFGQLMEDLKSSNAGQEKYAKKQYRMSQIAALCNVVILGIVVWFFVIAMPKFNQLYENLEVVLAQIEIVTSELADADLTGMVNNVDHLITSSENNINNALNQVNSIDIKSLNKAIEDLGTIVAPIARLFGHGN